MNGALSKVKTYAENDNGTAYVQGYEYEEGKTYPYYCYYFPETSCVNHYNEDKDLFWSVSADYYEGPEVEKDIQRILVECRKVSGKGKKRAKAKELIRETFHTEKGKRPYWIQGSEWPRGKYSPMKYICSKRIPDGKVFLFSDVDTGEMREIEQYY